MCPFKMNGLCTVLLVALPICCYSSTLNEVWKEWKIKHGKAYDNQAEVNFRKAIWEKNLELIWRHNQEAAAGKHSFTLGLNHFADMTAEEVNCKLNGLRPEEPNTLRTVTLKKMSDLPKSVDWREQGLVSAVQNQGNCASCYAFSSLGALEGQMSKHTGVLVPLSVQNLVDCSSSKDGNFGCKGGSVLGSYDYIIRNKGIDSEAFYPYKQKNGICRYSEEGKAGNCSKYIKLPSGDEENLQAVVADVGPVSVSVNAMLPSFRFYKEGVYDDPECSSSPLTHAVLLVGYGSDKGQDYWLVKNSSGTGWGEGGYIRIARNKNNTCGIASKAVYPIL